MILGKHSMLNDILYQLCNEISSLESEFDDIDSEEDYNLLSKEQKELLKQLEVSLEADHGKHSPRTDSWLSRAKQFFEK